MENPEITILDYNTDIMFERDHIDKNILYIYYLI